MFFESKLKEEDIILVEADEEKLTQVIDNILDNAFKFTDANGSVALTLEKQEEHPWQWQKEQQLYANIIVKDNGTGIDPQILQRLF